MNQLHDVVISTDGLSKTFGSVAALTDLDLRVPRHTIFAVLGPNGAGKSTLIKLLLGLIRPTRGRATIFGRDSVRDSLAIRERLGYLAQEPRYYAHMTARDTLRFVAGFFAAGPAGRIEERIAELLELVGLADRADRPIGGFSGGEWQRLGIAQAQINEPELLILDEPAAALDPLGRRDVLDVMERLRQRTTIVYSTHLLDDVQRVSDTVAILNRGTLVAQAPIADLLSARTGGIYTLTLAGDVQAIQARLGRERWVRSSVVVAGNDTSGGTRLDVTVDDVAAAEAGLLPVVVLDGRATVLAFGRKQHTLEDVFVELIEGGTRDGRT